MTEMEEFYMVQEMEYEKKLLLTYNEFQRVRLFFPFPNDPIVQTNDYFETKDFLLRHKQCALRIRQIENQYTLTLKEQRDNGILETHAPLTNEQVIEWKNNDVRHTNHVIERLVTLSIPLHKLAWIGSLTTERWIYKRDEIAYMLDRSQYNGIVDYEIEVEARSLKEAMDALQTLMSSCHLTKKQTLPKIARLYASLQSY